MKDPLKPSLFIPTDGSAIHITIPQTTALLSNQGYTYDQATFTYNQTGISYGGVYKTNQDVVPFFTESAINIPIDIFIQQTDALLSTQGYIYNQASFAYNQSGVNYGGIYHQGQDISPAFFEDTAYTTTPSISVIIDIPSSAPTPPPSGNSGMLIGMLGLTYP